MGIQKLTDEEATALAKLFGGSIDDGLVLIPNKGINITVTMNTGSFGKPKDEAEIEQIEREKKETKMNEALIGAVSVLTEGLADAGITKAAKWYCELNSFHWPDDFPLPKPAGYEAMTDKEKFKDPIQRLAFDEVVAFVPQKEKIRAWHKGGYCGDPKNDEEFEEWWRTTGRAYFEPMNSSVESSGKKLSRFLEKVAEENNLDVQDVMIWYDKCNGVLEVIERRQPPVVLGVIEVNDL